MDSSLKSWFIGAGLRTTILAGTLNNNLLFLVLLRGGWENSVRIWIYFHWNPCILWLWCFKTCSIQGPHLMGDMRWQSDQGDAMSMSTINSFQSFVAMMAVWYSHSQSMDAFVVFVNVLTRAQPSLHSSIYNQWRNPLIVEEQHSIQVFPHLFIANRL